jgi:hypothetical protein
MGLHWAKAQHAHPCSECDGDVLAGDRIAIYDDVASQWPFKPVHVRRIYCEDCGHLLEDSLITTEAA